MKATEKNIARLGRDVKRMTGDLEDLLKGIPRDLSEESEAARRRVVDALDSTRILCHQLEQRALAGVTASNEFVHDNPWRFIAGAAGLGLLLGALFIRK